MDFPKSVPSVGLVGGKFVDENPLLGTPGSLIPCQWGNAVTNEMLAVISAAGLVPDEEDNSQLLQAISELLSTATPEATDTVLGLVKQASKQEAEDGLDDKKSMSALRVHQAIAKKTANVVISTTASKVLVANDLGLVLVDSSAGATNITLPASNGALGVRDVVIRRVDNGGNRLTVTAAGTDKIKFHTHLSPTGYPFFVLMGAGDWWRLRSDGAGYWWPIGRCDPTALGRPVMETTTAFPPGGYGAVSGPVFIRAEWPWLWDHAQQSGMLKTEAQRVGNEGGWTQGDGVSTFRGPEIRGEFQRMLDESRGVDASTINCTATAGSAVLTAVVSTTQLAVGMSLATFPTPGVAIPVGATIVSFTSNTITMSANATATAVGMTVAVAGRVAGSSEPDALQNIIGNLGDTLNVQSHGSGAFYTVPGGTAAYPTGNSGNFNQFNFDASRVVRTSIETRARNIAYPGRIKLI